MAERQFGPYRLIRQIAVGGMAEIHLAKTAGIAGFEKYVALKMIHPNFAENDQFIQMLVDEAKIAVQLSHGNIAQTFDLGRVGDTYYITMEYVDGADLYKILRRASEQNLEMPLDVCAFIGKEISSALDHAHRKRDHGGRPLGIVHRDVSPQNVLVSYSGEVKLVDFGIAKATMKVRQTAVGVIKGKYYYMSPEQAWGNPIDHRSDIFSAGIVLYEMITGQMLYFEEDLHKLLEMARSANIVPPGKRRRGVPPQLDRIVMHALARDPGERYQSAGDLATDLERFLHAYSPVFTASKLSSLLRKVVGEPVPVPAGAPVERVELRDGGEATHPLDDAEVARAADRDGLRDENSVLFRVSDLAKAKQAAPAPPDATRRRAPLATPAPSARPRQLDEETRQVQSPSPESPPEDPIDDDESSGPFSMDGDTLRLSASDRGELLEDDLENIGERTMVTAAPGAAGTSGAPGFMMDVAGEGGDDLVEATLVTAAPTHGGGKTDEASTAERPAGPGAKVERDFALGQPIKPARPRPKAPPPPALAAKIHAPAVSELRKPRPSRRTPPDGSPIQPPNVLQAIVSSHASEPMPAPRPAPAPPPPPAPPVPAPPPPAMVPHSPYPPMDPFASPLPVGAPGAQPAYSHDASGLPLGIPTPPGMSLQPVPGVPAHLQPYLHLQGMPPGYGAQQAMPPPPHGSSQPSPGALYPFPQPPPLHAMSITAQMRLFEIDELPARYKLDAGRRRRFTYVILGVLAVSLAAAVTFFIIRSIREGTPSAGSVHIVSVPAGADVIYDHTRLTGKTPLTIRGAPVGSHHTIRLELARHEPYEVAVDIPKTGGEVPVTTSLKPILGKIVVDSAPPNAEIRINGQLRGRTPTTITDVDMDSANRIELRLKGYQPLVQDLTWPSDGTIRIQAKLILP